MADGALRHLICATILIVSPLFIPAHTFVPYIYAPTPQKLKGAGISIGHVAAQLLQLNQPQESAKLAALAVQLRPRDDRLWSILAEAQLRSGQLGAAARSLAQAKELNPNKAELWFAEASLALRANRPKIAVDLLDHGLELDPDNASAYFDLGNARIMQDQFRLALKAFEKATAIRPGFWEALNNQALVLFEMGNRSEAIRRWRHVLEINASPESMLALAAALNSEQPGDNEAFNLATKALATDPNYVLTSHQKQHLWGLQLRWATERLLEEPTLRTSVVRAEANASPDNYQHR